MNTIGQRIKYFRERAGRSQLDLEVAIDASTGSISRMETGKVNPTKETLSAIAASLKLDIREQTELFGLLSFFPTDIEIAEALNEVKDYFSNPNTVAYLIDEWANLHYASKGIVSLLGLTDKQLSNLLGRNILEIALDPIYGVSQRLDPDHLIETLAVELSRINKESDIAKHRPDLVTRLQEFSLFKSISELSQTIGDEILDPNTKIVHFIMQNGMKVRMNFSREKLKQNNRFEVIEYFNPQPY